MRRLMWPLVCFVIIAAGTAASPPLDGERQTARLAAANGPAPQAAKAKRPGAAIPPADRHPGPRASEPAVRVPIDRAAPLPGAWSARNANYAIDAALDAQAHMISGRAVVTWRNTSSAATSELRVHLYYNAWKNARSTWMREARLARPGRTDNVRPDDWGWIEVNGIRLLPGDGSPVDLTSRKRYIAPDDGNAEDQTVMAIPLPGPVGPGESVTVDIGWDAKVPRTFARTGAIGNYFFLAQWFPKIGVLEDGGWNCHQFHAGTEFFADYGVYDVRLRVPRGWIVGASGREQSRTDTAENTTTFAYRAEDVHDFAWTTSPDYLEHRERFEHPTLPAVEMRLLLQPEHADQAERHFEATRAALKSYGEWFGPYPYGYITIIDPAWQSGAGGMEYPTLFTAGSRWLISPGVTQPEGVTVHEAGHQFWYGLVGNNEFEDAWLDEGLNTYSTARAIDEHPQYRVNFPARRFFGGFVPYVFKDATRSRAVDGNGLSGYRAAARSDDQSTPSWRYFPASGGGLSYNKTALWLHTLERYLGWPTFQRVLSTFFDRWKFRHPKPADFFGVVNEVSGRDLTWFFDQVYRSSNVFDYAIDTVRTSPVDGPGYVDRNGRMELAAPGDSHSLVRTVVIVRRLGEAVFPVDVRLTLDSGEQIREPWDGRDRWRAITYEGTSRVIAAEVDPDRVLLLDINRTNNSWSAAPAGREAGRKWMLKWIVWLQDALLNAGFFM
jgi:hypothetical protein